MSLLLVKDNANSKIRELECDANGLLKVDKVDVSALATESTISSLNSKVTAVNTGAVVVSSSALPAGGATSALQTTCNSSLSSIDGKITACDTGSISGTVAVSGVSGNVACTHASLPLPSGASSEATLSTINGKITACDTSALATSANQSTANTSLATLAGCVSANVLSVSAGSVSKTASYVWGSGSSTASISGSSSANSTVFDCRTLQKIVITGNTSNLSDSNIEVEVSHDNSEFFELTSAFLSIDYNSGHFGKTLDAPFNYVRLKRSNTQITSESIKAVISGY